MVLTGYARKLQADLNPSLIIDPKTTGDQDPALLAAGCLMGVDQEFAERVREGDILVIDGTLGGGEGAELAVVAMQAAGIAVVVCADVAAELCSNGASYGLPFLVAAEAALGIAEGMPVRIDLERGRLDAAGASWVFTPLTGAQLAAVRRAQLLARMRRVVEVEGYGE